MIGIIDSEYRVECKKIVVVHTFVFLIVVIKCCGIIRDSTKNLFVTLALEALATFRVLLACLSFIH